MSCSQSNADFKPANYNIQIWRNDTWSQVFLLTANEVPISLVGAEVERNKIYALLEMDRVERCRESFLFFVRQMWPGFISGRHHLLPFCRLYLVVVSGESMKYLAGAMFFVVVLMATLAGISR